MSRVFKIPILVIFLLVSMLVLPVTLEQDEDIPHNEVKNWALKFGVDLWEYGRQLTRMNELQRKYHEVELDIERKDGLLLIREMAAEVKNMMDFKMSAVMRIMDSAEQIALTPQNDNGNIKYFNAKKLNIFGHDGKPADGSREMMLTANPHFDYLPVNTSFSSVLIPSDIHESDPDVINSIQRSEHLDPLFVNNYEDDPSLSWQYFGSSSGYLRRYPAIAWPPEEMSTAWQRSSEDRNVYDFRRTAWYVTAATSPKDIVILVDSLTASSGRHLAITDAIVTAILDTLTNDDFVNIFKFSEIAEESVRCFQDVLVQANNENKRWLRESIKSLRADDIDKQDFTNALIKGFEILHKYNRTGQGCQCNQAIMLITTEASSKHKELFKKYNWPHKPVRIFTYLVGSESASVEDLHWMACSNKGYYTRVSKPDEAKQQVLRYIEVMARPVVMYQNDHPIQWTSAYVGGRKDSLGGGNQGQLMTSVTTPVFDRRNHSMRAANILGVVGTDVSVEQIKKLVPPYKLGVNGYSFIVNNNGHVLYHPDVRPLYGNRQYESTLEPTYVTVDLSELELVEAENGPRENHSALLELRHDMIDQKEGETELTVKIHYDNMRRVTTRRHKYFYNPIEGTPFSLGLAIPEGYGMYQLRAEQEVKRSQKNVEEYFKGNNWKVHPDWVYCEYTNGPSGGDQGFSTAEERVLHFLSRSRRPGWKWMSLRPRSPSQRDHYHPTNKQDKDAYYCDKTLLQSLVLDAMVTEELERHASRPPYTEENNHPIATLLVLLQSQGFHMFGLTLSFVATRSGLLRWTDHTPPEQNQQHFSQSNVRAIDEVWYKRAVDQHAIEPESFVFSVPFDVKATSKSLVTATHAVFVEHGGHRAPAAVVGLQYQHSTLASHFINITSACTGPSACRKTCASTELDCYILDNNGFIIISENSEHTGVFFGHIDGTIMDSLVQDRIYNKVTVYDYQGSCASKRDYFSGSATPIKKASFLNIWLTNFLTFWAGIIHYVQGIAISYTQDPDAYLDYDPDDIYRPDDIVDESEIGHTHYTISNGPTYISDNDAQMDNMDRSEDTVRPCDRKVDLYVLQPDRLNTSGQSNPLKGKLTNCHVTGCERPFSVQKVPHSNLILLVVDTLCPCGSKQLSITPQELIYDNGNGRCLHKPKESLYRRRPPKCINYHPEEIEISLCGSVSRVTSAFGVFTTLTITLYLILS
nr:voltage-dependent calcium channel subunit alpha-2/delta-3 isoform X1 [Onthophagus taurus]